MEQIVKKDYTTFSLATYFDTDTQSFEIDLTKPILHLSLNERIPIIRDTKFNKTMFHEWFRMSYDFFNNKFEVEQFGGVIDDIQDGSGWGDAFNTAVGVEHKYQIIIFLFHGLMDIVVVTLYILFREHIERGVEYVRKKFVYIKDKFVSLFHLMISSDDTQVDRALYPNPFLDDSSESGSEYDEETGGVTLQLEETDETDETGETEIISTGTDITKELSGTAMRYYVSRRELEVTHDIAINETATKISFLLVNLREIINNGLSPVTQSPSPPVHLEQNPI